MFKIKYSLFICFLLLGIVGYAQSLKEIEANRVELPNGWRLTPVGKKLGLGDLPLNIALSPTGDYAAVTNNGQSDQSIMLIDTRTEKRCDSMPIVASWLGLAFSADGKQLYASGGNTNNIIRYNIENGKMVFKDTLSLGQRWPNKISPTGLCVDDKNSRLYVVTKEDSALYVLNTASNKVIRRQKLPAEAYTCLLSPDKKKLYISIWGGGDVLIYDTKKDTTDEVIQVGSNPNDMAITKDGKYLFVANANDNSVSVISTEKKQTIETLNAALYPDAPEGSTTNSVGLSVDDKTLYIANADNNCLAVFDVTHPGKSASKGFIPTGWYPTCVRVIKGEIWVTNGKGFSSMANPYGPNPTNKNEETNYKQGDKNKPHKEQYIGGLFTGTMSIIPMPDDKQLAEYSLAVYGNTPYNKDKAMSSDIPVGNPIPAKVGMPSPIKYVFYVMKENRTYDQVLGDMPKGNGDTSLCLFPAKITPNQHALASEFVLLDNFYVDAEVSADGHNWTMAAYANDYIEKTWPTSYGGRGGTYDYSGNRKIALPKSGFIWDNCLQHNVSFRNYGEFRDDNNGKVYLKNLASHTCATYKGWNLAYHDVDREKVWEKDFDSLVAANAVPQFSIVYLPNDHTSGLAKNAFTPFASVADNDQALGKLIEHLSQSPIWKQCAVFVLEDDAQDGPDHVDAHRSTAYVISPYIKHNYADHTMYSTSSMLHTVELILGLPPMSQYDAAAVPMWRSFTDSINTLPYISKPSNINIDDRNVAYNDLMRKSDKFNFKHEDGVPEEAFNEVLWKAIKGMQSNVPAAKHSSFVMPLAVKDDD